MFHIMTLSLWIIIFITLISDAAIENMTSLTNTSDSENNTKEYKDLDPNSDNEYYNIWELLTTWPTYLWFASGFGFGVLTMLIIHCSLYCKLRILYRHFTTWFRHFCLRRPHGDYILPPPEQNIELSVIQGETNDNRQSLSQSQLSLASSQRQSSSQSQLSSQLQYSPQAQLPSQLQYSPQAQLSSLAVSQLQYAPQAQLSSLAVSQLQYLPQAQLSSFALSKLQCSPRKQLTSLTSSQLQSSPQLQQLSHASSQLQYSPQAHLSSLASSSPQLQQSSLSSSQLQCSPQSQLSLPVSQQSYTSQKLPSVSPSKRLQTATGSTSAPTPAQICKTAVPTMIATSTSAASSTISTLSEPKDYITPLFRG